MLLYPKFAATRTLAARRHCHQHRTQARRRHAELVRLVLPKSYKKMGTCLRILSGAARAAKLARIPPVVANVLRKLDEQEVLGKNVAVVGTKAGLRI